MAFSFSVEKYNALPETNYKIANASKGFRSKMQRNIGGVETLIFVNQR